MASRVVKGFPRLYKMEPMRVYVLPVSGGYFPLQIAELLWMDSPPPSLVLGSSGGNIAAYLATAGVWTREGIQQVMTNMYSGLFIKSWWPAYLPYLPSVLKGYFKGSAYNSNDEFVTLFKRLFDTPEAATTLAATELWSGTYNTTAGATQLFCSTAQASALLQPNPSLNQLYNVVPPVYASGDLPTLAKVCFASAAVPAVFPAQSINDALYIDGGTSYSSPLTPLRSELSKAITGRDVHITYFSPYDMQASSFNVCYEPVLKTSATQECAPGTMYNQGVDAFSEIFKSMMLQDRMAGVSLIGDPETLAYTEEVMDYDQFQAFQAKRAAYTRSFVEVYPLSKDHISIVSFGPEDIQKVIASVTSVGVRSWVPVS